ncbi:MAG: alkaline phosphatase family protein [Armatimonadota bacterium]|nr:alkaline phosphatase family protein [Armatimonadota bacterium]
MMMRRKRECAALVISAGLLIGVAGPCHAYIGPGAGMVFLSSFLAIILAFVMAFVLIALGLFRWLLGLFRRQKRRAGAKVRRVVVIGMDGMSPPIMDRLMEEGRLPNFRALADQGTYRRLRTTCPPLSPVAWSTFATGSNPGKHGIFDFLRRNPFSYQLELSSTRTRQRPRNVGVGPLKVQRSATSVELEQKGKAFWEVLGENGVFSAAIRVPISYPPPQFNGVALAGMCAPDLLGTQGTFAYYTTEADEIATYESGLASLLERDGNGRLRGEIRGPERPGAEDGEPLTIPFELRLNRQADGATLTLQAERVELSIGEYTDWVPVSFRAGTFRRARGITRFLLLEAGERVRLYQLPLNIDPASPSMPIASPLIFSSYLARAHGSFATLGLAEDTWGLNEGILPDDAFIEQCYIFHRERRKLLFDMLDKVREGAVVLVFDITDRMQHMFLGRDGHGADPAEAPEVVERVYEDMDELLGLIRKRLDDETVLFVMSDHGFGRFARCVDLNRWLHDEGYLAVDEEGAIDWPKTRAYAMGLAGIYINLAGREAEGIVQPEAAQALKEELAERLMAAEDPETGETPIQRAFDSQEVYSGPFAENAPDLIIGYRRGYRVSWESAGGDVGERAFCPNPRPWAADHCLHPAEVPGVLFCSHEIDAEDIWIGDIGPTVLGLFGIEKPSIMDGWQLDVAVGEPGEGTEATDEPEAVGAS